MNNFIYNIVAFEGDLMFKRNSFNKLKHLVSLIFIMLNIILFIVVVKYYNNTDVISIAFICGVIHTWAFNHAQKDLFEIENNLSD